MKRTLGGAGIAALLLASTMAGTATAKRGQALGILVFGGATPRIEDNEI
jgi:hypothetical protein